VVAGNRRRHSHKLFKTHGAKTLSSVKVLI